MPSSKLTLCAALMAALSFAAPVHASEDTSRPRANFNTCDKPHYPAESLAAKHEGTVRLMFLVDVTGAVQDAKVEKSSGYEALDVAARDAIRLCKFTPAMEDGKATQKWANVQYVWTLDKVNLR